MRTLAVVFALTVALAAQDQRPAPLAVWAPKPAGTAASLHK